MARIGNGSGPEREPIWEHFWEVFDGPGKYALVGGILGLVTYLLIHLS